MFIFTYSFFQKEKYLLQKNLGNIDHTYSFKSLPVFINIFSKHLLNSWHVPELVHYSYKDG